MRLLNGGGFNSDEGTITVRTVHTILDLVLVHTILDLVVVQTIQIHVIWETYITKTQAWWNDISAQVVSLRATRTDL